MRQDRGHDAGLIPRHHLLSEPFTRVLPAPALSGAAAA